MFENLGIVYDRKCRVKNHRSVLKVICNPFLRHFGWNICSEFNFEEDKIVGLELRKCKKIPLLEGLRFKHNLYLGEYIIKKRVWW